MSKHNVLNLWNLIYKNKEDVYDYSGRQMKRSAIGNHKSAFEPTIDHIRPISKGGRDVSENIILCNRMTNQEKGDKFSTWNANNKTFQAVRVKGNRSAYKVK